MNWYEELSRINESDDKLTKEEVDNVIQQLFDQPDRVFDSTEVLKCEMKDDKTAKVTIRYGLDIQDMDDTFDYEVESEGYGYPAEFHISDYVLTSSMEAICGSSELADADMSVYGQAEYTGNPTDLIVTLDAFWDDDSQIDFKYYKGYHDSGDNLPPGGIDYPDSFEIYGFYYVIIEVTIKKQ